MSDKLDFYFARVNDELASLFVDLGIRETVPGPCRTQLIWCWVYMNQPRPDGLSSSDEAPLLMAIEESLVDSLKEQATFVGRITTAGRREFYFYGEDAAQCEATISHAMGNYSAYRFDVGSNQDEQWSQYLDLLHPSPEDSQRIKNRRTIEVLQQQGDQPWKPRPVLHWAYFATQDARDAFVAEVTGRAFTIANYSTNQDTPSQYPYGVTVEKIDSVDRIDDVTIELFRLARLHNGDYDGWEASVEESS